MAQKRVSPSDTDFRPRVRLRDDDASRWVVRVHAWVLRPRGVQQQLAMALSPMWLDDRTRLCIPDPDWEIEGETTEDFRRVKLSRLHPGEQCVYVFDLGDDWAHLCTVGPERIDPVETLGILPDRPLPYWGWGDIPDQYRRRWDGDDGESPRPKDPKCTDLPPLRPGWGPESHWGRP